MSEARFYLHRSGSEIARAIREGEVRSVEVVSDHIALAKSFQPRINALVEERFAQALDEARAADALVAKKGKRWRHQLPPFLGVPCSVKEAFAFAGMRQTAGHPARREYRATETATVVGRLQAAGAIPIGTTNVPELCMWMETDNQIYGRTNNPYDPSRIAGGSSGGEGALIGSGASPFGVGSDVGGSIRMPAFFNGIFGHKPTPGLVPNTGQWPIAEGEGHRWLCTGPMARRAEDLYPLLQIFAGPDGADSVCRDMPLGDPSQVDLSKLRIFDLPWDSRRRIDPQLRDVQRRAAAHLKSLGARVERLQLPELARSYDMWSCALHATTETTFVEMFTGGGSFSARKELLRWAIRRGGHTLPAIVLAAVERSPDLVPGYLGKWLRAGDELRARVHELLGEDGVILYPSYPVPAPRHYRPLLRPVYPVYCGIWNVMEVPATQVPMGLDRDGLPLGLQVIAGPGRDHIGLALASELELCFGGWRPPALGMAASV